jgi:hypothetical protein
MHAPPGGILHHLHRDDGNSSWLMATVFPLLRAGSGSLARADQPSISFRCGAHRCAGADHSAPGSG